LGVKKKMKKNAGKMNISKVWDADFLQKFRRSLIRNSGLQECCRLPENVARTKKQCENCGRMI